MDALREIEDMNVKSLLSVLFKTRCKVQQTKHEKATDKLNERLRKVEDHMKQRATVDGEDEWFLTLRRHSKNGECKS